MTPDDPSPIPLIGSAWLDPRLNAESSVSWGVHPGLWSGLNDLRRSHWGGVPADPVARPAAARQDRCRRCLPWTVRAGTVLGCIALDRPSVREAAITTCRRACARGMPIRQTWPGVLGADTTIPTSMDLLVGGGISALTAVQRERILVTRAGQVMARTNRAELHARLRAQLFVARSDKLRSAQVMAIPGVRSVRQTGGELHVTADLHASVAAALQRLDPQVQVRRRPLIFQDVFQGLCPPEPARAQRQPGPTGP